MFAVVVVCGFRGLFLLRFRTCITSLLYNHNDRVPLSIHYAFRGACLFVGELFEYFFR